jgi:hypothetical protein
MPNSTPISKLVCVPVSSKSPSPISPINGSPTGILKKQGSVDGSELLSPSKVGVFCCTVGGLCRCFVCR